MNNLVEHLDQLWDTLIAYVPKLFLAILTLIIGLWVIKRIKKCIEKLIEKRDMDDALRSFITGILSVLLKIMLFISVIGMIGVEMTSFIAILGAAGLAVGMALSGSLQNFAGGVMIMIFKPFKTGDLLEAQGYLGVVKEIQIFNTILLSLDNKTIIIPNGGLSTGSMVNFSTQDIRRVDMSFGIGYSDDIDQAKAVLTQLIENHPKVLKDPAYFIAVSELADSSVNFVVRAWTKSADYWDLFFYMQETVKKEFDKNKIGIPFPQRDVHVYKH